MNETVKTLILLLCAIALIAVAFWSKPTRVDFQPEEMVGKTLFPQFTDPSDIQSLEIVQWNAAGESSTFRIAEVNGIWSIPSHDNYPADAQDQMGKVAESLTNLTVLDVIQPEGSGLDPVGFQTLYGVIDPESDNTSIGEGVGTKITLIGTDNEILVNLIVGKVAEKTDRNPADMMGESDTNLRYVRAGNQSPVYVVDIDTVPFSIQFDQWIEKNLLDISTLDVKEFYVDQYSFAVDIVLSMRGIEETSTATFIGDLLLSYDGSAVGAEKWSLIRQRTFNNEKREYQEQPITSDKELDTAILDSMVSALDDLKIVSVLKKPPHLASVLREGKAFTDKTEGSIEFDETLIESMKETGFYLVSLPDLKGGTQQTTTQLLSNEGMIQLRLKDGIVYNLRFGDLTGTESELATEEQADPASAESSETIVSTGTVPAESTPAMGANRYLFITAEFDPSIIALPELKPVPDIPEEGTQEDRERLTQEKESIEKANQREQERYDGEIEQGKKRASELTNRFADWYFVIAEDVYKKIHLIESNVFRTKVSENVDPTAGLLQPVTGSHLPAPPELPMTELDSTDMEPVESAEINESESNESEPDPQPADGEVTQ